MNGDEAMEWLAKFFGGLSDRDGGSPVLGRVLSPDPLRVLCGGTVQERDGLLANADLLDELDADPAYLKEGDKLALLPIEERQRYIILCKVVAV